MVEFVCRRLFINGLAKILRQLCIAIRTIYTDNLKSRQRNVALTLMKHMRNVMKDAFVNVYSICDVCFAIMVQI